VRQVVGAAFAEEALALEGERDGIRARAWLVRSRSGLGRILGVTFLVNGRPVQDRGLAHAVREASERLFGMGEGAAGLVMLDMPAADVDVNVHPAKREVRLARPAHVHDTLRDLLRGEAVAAAAFGPALDLAEGSARIAVAPTSPVAESWTGASRAPASPGLPAGWAPTPRPPLPSGRRILGQHRNTYILVEDDQGLVLVDQHAAHERVLYERVIAGIESSSVGQSLLEPVVVEVSRAAAERLKEHLPDLARLGFDVEEFGAGAFTVRTVPAIVGTADPAELLRELAAAEDGPSTLERVHRVAATIACKAAVKAGFSLGHERMRFIVDALMACETPTTCPHGRVALLRLSDRDLDHRFGRI
jgi:DNA mismatch repair protein MutL